MPPSAYSSTKASAAAGTGERAPANERGREGSRPLVRQDLEERLNTNQPTTVVTNAMLMMLRPARSATVGEQQRLDHQDRHGEGARIGARKIAISAPSEGARSAGHRGS